MRARETVSNIYNTSVWAFWKGMLPLDWKELRGCLVLKKSHDKNILAPVGSASANKHRISYIYSTAGKML